MFMADLHDTLVLKVLLATRGVPVLPERIEGGVVQLVRELLLHEELNLTQRVISDALKHVLSTEAIVDLNDDFSNGIGLELKGR